MVFGVVNLTGGSGNRKHRPTASAAFGAGAGLLIGSYTVWDAYAVTVLMISPLLLDYFSSVARCGLLLPLALRRRDSLGSGPINLMQFCLKETSRMMLKKRKTRLCAFSSIFRLQAGVFLQTRRAGSILPLTSLKGLENHKVSSDLSPCQMQNILPQNG